MQSQQPDVIKALNAQDTQSSWYASYQNRIKKYLEQMNQNSRII